MAEITKYVTSAIYFWIDIIRYKIYNIIKIKWDIVRSG